MNHIPILSQILVILSIALGGELIAALLPLPLPGSILAMILLFLLLQKKLIDYNSIFPVGDFLLKNMAIFLVPASVNIIRYFPLINNYLWQFLLICLVSTVLAFFATYATTKLLIKALAALQARKEAAR